MNGSNGIHHLAIATKDIKSQIEFFSDVLGFELVALYWMHGVEGAWHGFMKLNDNSSIAFVETPDVKTIERTIGLTHAGNGANACAGGTMQHLALNVESLEDLYSMRDRIRSRGVTVFGPIDHGMCHSMYFAGPEDLSLEVATSSAPIDALSWIDPEVVELAGITADELRRYKHPAAFTADAPVAQPAFDESKPYQRGYTVEEYTRIISIPDDVLLEKFSYTEPPVDIKSTKMGA